VEFRFAVSEAVRQMMLEQVFKVPRHSTIIDPKKTPHPHSNATTVAAIDVSISGDESPHHLAWALRFFLLGEIYRWLDMISAQRSKHLFKEGIFQEYGERRSSPPWHF